MSVTIPHIVVNVAVERVERGAAAQRGFKRVTASVDRSHTTANITVTPLPVRVIDASDPYTGEYSVDPLFTAVTLETQNKRMLNDVTVNAIYKAETSNPAGGKTVYIGGEFIG